MEIDELILGIIVEEVGKILSEAPLEPAEVLNPFSPRSSFFLDFALLGSFGRTLTEPFSSR
jgi:hypothetical protein